MTPPDSEPFTPAAAQRAWNQAAEAWDEFVDGGADYYRTVVHGPGLLAACGDVCGRTVLDLGCGEGYFTRLLASNGARVTGVDIAERQIARACRHEGDDPLGIDYRVLDAVEIAEHWPRASFDAVTACMSLHDMPDPGGVIGAVRRVLRCRGRFVFSVPHPLTDTPYREWSRAADGSKRALMVGRYFESGHRMVQWNMQRLKYGWEAPTWRFTLSEWSDLLTGAGFLIRRMHEPRPTREQVSRQPELDDACGLPYFLIIDAVAAGS